MQVLSHLNPELAAALLQSGFSPMDLLFYGIAAYEGYRFSFRRITAEEGLKSAIAWRDAKFRGES